MGSNVNRGGLNGLLAFDLASYAYTVLGDVGELKDFAHLTYQSGSDPGLFSANIVRVLRGFSDGRERAARDYAAKRLDWRAIVSAAEPEIAKRAFPKETS